VLKPGAMLYPGKLKEVVETTGFTPGDIHMKAKGELVINSDKDTKEIARLAFKIPESDQIFLLHSPRTKERDKKQQSSEQPDLLVKLIEAFDAGKKKSTLGGQVHQHKELPVGLAVEEFEFADKKE